jgi:hypothetical protein
LFSRLLLFGWRRRVFREWGFRLNVDGHFFRQFDPPRLEIDNRKRGGVKREHDRDDDRAEPRRADGRRLEGAPVQRRGSHGAGAFGVGAAGAVGAA